MHLSKKQLRQLINEELANVINEVRTDVLTSAIARGLHLAISKLRGDFTNRGKDNQDEDMGPLNLGVVSFKFVSETGFKNDVHLDVRANLLDDFTRAPVLEGFKLVRKTEPWDNLIKNSSSLSKIKLNQNDIDKLDKQGFLNGMKSVSIAFLINDTLYEKFRSKDNPLRAGVGAAVDKVKISYGNGFKDSPTDKKVKSKNLDKIRDKGIESWAKNNPTIKKAAQKKQIGTDFLSTLTTPMSDDELQQKIKNLMESFNFDDFMANVTAPMTESFQIISLAIMPENKKNFRNAFHVVVSTIVHEVEHAFQKDGASSAKVFAGGGSMLQKRAIYLTMQDEVEAHVSQFYYLQKKLGIPFINLIKDYLNHELKGLQQVQPTITQKQKNEFFEKIINIWKGFAKKRFPEAIL